MRNLDTLKHLSNKYVIVFIYFSNKDKNENFVIAKITREVYLVENLKINILIKNNLIDFEKIVINIIDKLIFINNCNVIVFLKVKTSRVIIYTLKYVKKNNYRILSIKDNSFNLLQFLIK